MTISKRVRSQFFTSSSAPAGTTSSPSKAIMASSIETEAPLAADSEPSTLIRLPLTRSIPGKRKRKSRANKSLASQQRKALGWSDEEHDRFLHALELYPTGPWKNVAAFVGTKTTRQVMTHAQKYRQKIKRWQRNFQATESPDLAPTAPDSGGGASPSSDSGAQVKSRVKLSSEDDDNDPGSVAASSPKCKNQTAESLSANPIKFERLDSGTFEKVALEYLHRSASYKAIDALLSNWQSALSVDSEEGLLDLESLSDLHLDTETVNF